MRWYKETIVIEAHRLHRCAPLSDVSGWLAAPINRVRPDYTARTDGVALHTKAYNYRRGALRPCTAHPEGPHLPRSFEEPAEVSIGLIASYRFQRAGWAETLQTMSVKRG